jgi:hypothetical protein
MKQIQLTKGQFALVDDEDYEYLNQFKWHVSPHKNTKYAERGVTLEIGKYTVVSMHITLMKPSKGMDIDHKDHNGLNCQKYNLRICTRQQNHRNRRKRPNLSSKYKGVTWDKYARKWKSAITIDRKPKHLGNFSSELEAALAYNKKAKELFGEYACLNVVLNKRKERNNG